MSAFFAVMPSIWPPYTETCLASMAPEFRASTLVVSNVERNRGVAASWNLGIRTMRKINARWLVIVSAAVRFGQPGGLDFLEALERDTEDVVVQATRFDPDGPGPQYVHDTGLHLIAFSRTLLDKVGEFDENFWPIYYEDTDYARRIQLATGYTSKWSHGSAPPYWPKVRTDMESESFGHAVQFAGVKDDPGGCRAYYTAKWGGEPLAETFVVPFNAEGSEGRLDWWPRPPDSRARKHAGWSI